MAEIINAILERIFKVKKIGSIYFQEKGKDKIKNYFHALFLIFVVSFVPSIPLIYYGIYYDSSLALVIGGTWRAVCTLLLMLAAAPIGMIYEIATGSVLGSGERYVQRISGVFISELLFTLIISIIPVSNNPKMFPIFLLAAVIFGYLGAMSMKQHKHGVSILVGFILVGLVLSFYFPNTFREIRTGIAGLDMDVSKPKPLKYTLRDYEAGKVEFFYPNGESKVWYVEINDDKIELLSNKGFHTGIGIESSPITRAILEKLKKNNWKNLSPSNVINGQPKETHPVTSGLVTPETPKKEGGMNSRRQLDEGGRYREQEEFRKREMEERKIKEANLRKETEEAERVHRGVEESIRKDLEQHKFEELIAESIIDINWKPESIWIQQLNGKIIFVNYTDSARIDAAKVVMRLRNIGAKVSHNVVTDREAKPFGGNVYYSFNDLKAATAIQAAVVDIVRVSLTSTGASGKINIWIN